MAKVDILQLVITNAAIIGVGLTWLNFTKKKLTKLSATLLINTLLMT